MISGEKMQVGKQYKYYSASRGTFIPIEYVLDRKGFHVFRRTDTLDEVWAVNLDHIYEEEVKDGE